MSSRRRSELRAAARREGRPWQPQVKITRVTDRGVARARAWAARRAARQAPTSRSTT